jgi:TetR/AcrR family transcriptional repressor of bet genes
MAGSKPPGRRQAAKDMRRLQLIRATLSCVARRGLADTTMAHITQAAGLSAGIVNLHFESKEKLFIETLRFLADEYEAACNAALDKAGPSAAERLGALVELDFSPKISERGKLAVWFSFWGEVKARPVYTQICAEKDRRYDQIITGLCRQITDDGGYQNVDVRVVATGFTALADGLWLDLLTQPKDFSREEAKSICYYYLHASFPRHFG